MHNNVEVKLSTKEGTISNCLLSNKTLIDAEFNDSKLSLATYKADVKKLVLAINDKPIEKKSQATKRFLFGVDKARSKYSILQLVWNTILAGDGNAVIH